MPYTLTIKKLKRPPVKLQYISIVDLFTIIEIITTVKVNDGQLKDFLDKKRTVLKKNDLTLTVEYIEKLCLDSI